jgi:hypothetical protein
MRLTVVLGASGEASFDIKLNDNNFVHKWIEELRWCLDNCEFNQQEAFSGLLTLSNAEQILNNACVTINKYMKGFIEIETDHSQEYFNYLHSKFEQLSGKFGKPTRLFSIANKELKTAIRNLNFYIHRLEDNKILVNKFYISFNKDQYRRHPLAESDYQYFEFEYSPGTLYLHYAELGKEFIDLYQDNLSIDYPGFANLHYYSGEAILSFESYNCFADTNYLTWLKDNDIDPYNKRLGHGKIPLGTVDLVNWQLIQNHQYIKEIIINE